MGDGETGGEKACGMYSRGLMASSTHVIVLRHITMVTQAMRVLGFEAARSVVW